MPRTAHRYLVVLDTPEESEATRKVLNKLNGVEISQATWIVPSFDPESSIYAALVSVTEPDVGIAVIPLLPVANIVHIRGTNEWQNKWRRIGLRGHTE